jgi:mycothiol synthase
MLPLSPPDLRALARNAQAVDGAPPFSDQALVDASSGAGRILGTRDAAAIVRPGEAELVVDPARRREGLGRALLTEVVEATSGELAIWAHGDHPGARALADEFGFAAVRRLLQQRAAVDRSPQPLSLPAGVTLAPFRPGVDDAAWLDLNARAFASHPEQGSLTQDDLDARESEAWFDADDFLLLWQGDDLVAFCWLKIEPDALETGEPGEFYAVGVAPDRQGQHLGGAAVDAGLARLAQRRIPAASLYVEGDNTAALRLYAARGFADHTVDVQYSLSR